jgi:acetylornithine deacetylase
MTPNTHSVLFDDAVQLLKQLIATPSFSREENHTADLIQTFFSDRNMMYRRKMNNIWSKNQHFNPDLPTILLNSHHDTVKPNAKWTLDPFAPVLIDDKLYGLGSNDAGGCLVALVAAFCYFYYRTDLPFNLIMAATAEEEVSGTQGIELLIKEKNIQNIAFAIVGEPTQMHLAIAEKGLLVIDCVAHGIAGHAARNEGDNAIYKALKDIAWIQNHAFERISEVLGPVKMSVTMINAGTQHNVVPDTCTFTIDCRVTEQYELEEIVAILEQNLSSEIKPRSIRLRSSGITQSHPFVQAGLALGRQTYGSPTLSDQALIPFTSVKCGPGHSERSHTADEFVKLSEIDQGIKLYIDLLLKMGSNLKIAS